MTIGQFVAAALVVALGAGIQGTVGFGQSLVAVPLLLLINPSLVPGPATIAGLALTVAVVVRDRRHADLTGLRWALVGLLPGTAAAALALAWLPQQGLEVAGGLLILIGVATSAFGVHVPTSTRNVTLAGALSGFMGTTVSVSGPPMALVYRRSSGGTLRATLASFFVAASVLTLVALVPVGKLGWFELGTGLALVPAAFVGFAVSSRLVGRVDEAHLRVAVLVVSAASAVAVLVRALA